MFLEKLKSFGILKTVKNNAEQLDLTDLLEENIELLNILDDNSDYLYVFTYVGVVIIGNRVIKCYPKYILTSQSPTFEMNQVLKIISKYSAKEQIINMYNGDGETSNFNTLAVILYLLNDYYECGIYTNSQETFETNGQGEILWDKTINDSFAIIRNNRPYYTEIYTTKTEDDDFDFFKRIHEYVLTECSSQLRDSGLIDLFDMQSIEISEEKLDEIADIEYIKYRLLSELSIQFSTRKQLLLKTLYAYFEHSHTSEDAYGISMYGTNSFNLIWESVCAEVLGNKLHCILSKLDLPVPLDTAYTSSQRLIEIIDKPIWLSINNDEKNAKETLTPDLINVGLIGEEYRFLIFDAKYYNIQLEQNKPLRSYPSVGDVTKQYLYQLAYKEFIEKHHISFFDNFFLMPTENPNYINKGIVKIKMLTSLGLSDIKVWQLPASEMYSKYLSGTLLNLDLFYN